MSSNQKFVTLFDAKTNIDFIGKGPMVLGVSFALAVVTLLAAMFMGLNWGIDFAGGSEVQVKFSKPVSVQQVTEALSKAGFEKSEVQQYGAAENNEWLVRVERQSSIDAAQKSKLEGIAAALAAGGQSKVEHRENDGDRVFIVLPQPAVAGDADGTGLAAALTAQEAALTEALEKDSGMRLRRTKKDETSAETTEGAVVRDEPYQNTVRYLVQFQGVADKLKQAFDTGLGGGEIRRVDSVDGRIAEGQRSQGVLALVFALLAIIAYMTIRFDLFFAPGALIATLHDPLLALMLFVFPPLRLEFDGTSIAAMLTIIGYSVNSTIVIYDRVRETMPADAITHDDVRQVVNRAINDTLSRSINTVMTTLFTTVAVAIFTTGSVQNFAITLSFGFVVGTISSIFIAPTVYLFFHKTFYNPAKTEDTAGFSKEDREQGIV